MSTLRNKYTKAETLLIAQLYPRAEWPTILQALLGRTAKSIEYQAHKRDITRDVRLETAWSNDELNTLRAHYGTESTAATAARLKRGINAVKIKASKEELTRKYTSENTRHNSYTDAEQLLITQLYPRADWPTLLAALPGRSQPAITHQAYKQDLTRELFEESYWSDEESNMLRAHYGTEPVATTAARLGRTPQAVRVRAWRDELTKGYSPRGTSKAGRKPLPKATPASKMQADASQEVALPFSAPTVPSAPVKRAPGTPNLNAAKAARQHKAVQQLAAVPVTAEELRKLPYNHPGRLAFMHNGQAGWQEWKKGAQAA